MRFAVVYLAATALAAASGLPSLAADLVHDQFLIQPTGPATGDEREESFIGGYAGLVGGYGIVNERWVNQFNGLADPDLNGVLAGVTAGFNWRSGSLLVGLEGDVNRLAMRGITDSPAAFVELAGIATARGRLGWIFGKNDQLAIFATGGVAHLWGAATNPAVSPPTFGFDQTGFVVGGGLEAYLMNSDRISSKLEYLYVGLNLNKTFPFAPPVGVSTLQIGGMHLFRWGLNVHF